MTDVFDRIQAEQLRKTIKEITDDVSVILPSVLATDDMLMNWVSIAINQIQDDLVQYTKTDPAAGGSATLVHKTYAAFHAVAAYRIAHAISCDKSAGAEQAREFLPRYLSEKAKARSGVEIHPHAKIGRRFVLDHGFNTVIGETCEIGDDVTILNDVVLGARGISGNPRARRHPRIGSRVSIAGNVGIFGPITVEDNVILNRGVIIAGRNVAAGTTISQVALLQVEKQQEHSRRPFKIYGLIPEENGEFAIHGKGLNGAGVALQICRWPKSSPSWGRSVNCNAVVETAAIGQDSPNWSVQKVEHSDKIVRVSLVGLKNAQNGNHLDSVRERHVSGDQELNVHLILTIHDGPRVELEAEELTNLVIEQQGGI